MPRKRKYYFKSDLPNIPPKQLKELLHKEVFELEDFKNDVAQVSSSLKIDEQIVKDVLISYFYNVARVINTVRKIKTKINIYGFFSLIVKPGRRI